MSKIEKIPFVTEDGEEIQFEVLEQTTIAGQNYLLVQEADADSEEDEVYIMKEIQAADDNDLLTYEFVEDDQELVSISKVFEELLEDTDIDSSDI